MEKKSIPFRSALEMVLTMPIHQPLVTEKREWLCKIGIYDVFKVIREPFDTYIATFGGKNAVIRDDEFLGTYAYHFLTLSYLKDFLSDSTIDPSLHLAI